MEDDFEADVLDEGDVEGVELLVWLGEGETVPEPLLEEDPEVDGLREGETVLEPLLEEDPEVDGLLEGEREEVSEGEGDRLTTTPHAAAASILQRLLGRKEATLLPPTHLTT